MTTIRIRTITDTHLYGVSPIMTLDEIINAAMTSPYPCFLTGDIVDIANAPYGKLHEALIVLEMLSNRFTFIRGNHENNAVYAPDSLYIENNQILISHGDIQSWGKEKSDKFRSGKPGAGWIKRNLISRPLDALRHLLAVRPNKRLLNFIEEEKAKNPNLKWIVLGHSHPKQAVYFEHMGVRGVICPQGVNDLVLDI